MLSDVDLSAAMMLAQSDATRMPAPKAFLYMVICIAIGIASLVGAFASNETLQSYASIIGTKNPVAARVACIFGVLVGFFCGTGFALTLLKII
jgi:hypothetical protein